MAKVSVIMPAYNVAPYIGAAIDSVFAQTFADWELVIADDGSTDNSANVARAYAAKDPRVKLVGNPNGGVSVARNHAIRESSGEFLAILDSDDLWEPTYLEKQFAIFDEHPEVDIVTGNGWFLGGRRHGLPARPWPDARPQPTLATILADEESIFIMTVMRRRVYDRIGGFNERLRSNEDYEYWLRAATHGFRFHRNDEPLGHYRRRDDSVSASDIRMLDGILVVYDGIRPLLAGRPEELRVLEAQVARFEGERLTAMAKKALHSRDAGGAANHLSALYAHRGGVAVRLASLMAKWTPRLLFRAYRLRRDRQEAAS